MKKNKNPNILFTTDYVDDDYFASSVLSVSDEFYKGALQFNLQNQRIDITFTLYEDGVTELYNFLSGWLEKNKPPSK